MKKKLFIVALLLGTTVTFAQKKELRAVGKAIKAKDFAAAQAQLKSLEGMMSSADGATKGTYYTYLAQANFKDGTSQNADDLIGAAEAVKMAKENGGDPDVVNTLSDAIRTAVVNSAVADQSAKRYEVAADKLEAMYRVNPQDTAFLYFAASNLVTGNVYDKAVKLYSELQDVGYTGITQKFAATDAETGELKDDFSSAQERDIYVKSGAFVKPTIIKTDSKAGEIAKNIALIYVSQGNNEAAIGAIKKARALNPDDSTLLMTEADIQYKTGNIDRFTELMNEAAAQDPDNPELQYNLGVVTADTGDTVKAKEYYKRAIELNPSYPAANMNMASLILAEEGPIVEEMNNLGTSAADNRRYDELKDKRTAIYNNAIPYLEAARSETEDIEVVRTLMNIYSIVGQTDKFKMMKAKLEELGG
ncbi:MAG: tetratricopeptide repeat protein [Gilvibacter sp.]